MQLIAYMLNHQACMLNSTHALTILMLTHYAIWEGKDRPSTDIGKEERKSTQLIAYMLNHQACKLNPSIDYPYAHQLCHLGGEGSTLHRYRKKKKVHAINCLYAQPLSLYAQTMPLLSLCSPTMPSGRGRIDPPQIQEKKESPRN